MKRRNFVKTLPLTALIVEGLTTLAGCETDTQKADAIKTGGEQSSSGSVNDEGPDWVAASV